MEQRDKPMSIRGRIEYLLAKYAEKVEQEGDQGIIGFWQDLQHQILEFDEVMKEKVGNNEEVKEDNKEEEFVFGKAEILEEAEQEINCEIEKPEVKQRISIWKGLKDIFNRYILTLTAISLTLLQIAQKKKI